MMATLLRDHPVDPAVVTEVARRCLDRPSAEVTAWSIEPVAFDPVSITTTGVDRIHGEAVDGGKTLTWSAFIKSVHSIRLWPMFEIVVPDFMQAQVAAQPWRTEAELYTSSLPAVLPDGFRMPRAYQVEDVGPEHVRLWLEDLDEAFPVWDDTRYARAAGLLGRLGGRCAPDRAPADLRHVTAPHLSLVTEGPLAHLTLPALAADATWAHPLIARAVDPALRHDLAVLAKRVPAWVERLDRLPRVFAHGDACPQNLLATRDDPDAFVAIDWGGFAGFGPVGADLAQLLAGRAHTGELRTGDLPRVHAAIAAAYTDGLRAEGLDIDPAEVAAGATGTLLLRTGFTALPLELLSREPTEELAALFRSRAGLARFIADLALAAG
jgi:hypothetical protein